jgi:REP element-mobilizing transposase RayT
VSQESGSYHIISRTVGAEILFHDQEKEYFLNLLERLAAGFFVQVHTFAILGNHFHLLVTNQETEAAQASKEELFRRYRRMFGKSAEPPPGIYDPCGELVPDEDGGLERLRKRLGSVSSFVKELKQTFSRWYNKNNKRKGYLWGDRFKSVIIGKGEAQVICSGYIDLNPVRANLCQRPEDYRWCSIGMEVRNPKRWRKLITPLNAAQPLSSVLKAPNNHVHTTKETLSSGSDLWNEQKHQRDWYREFVYISGGISRTDKASIAPELVSAAVQYHGRIGIGDRFRYRMRNISEGIALGSYTVIAELQKKYKRKFVRPRSFLNGMNMGNMANTEGIFVTRVLRS